MKTGIRIFSAVILLGCGLYLLVISSLAHVRSIAGAGGGDVNLITTAEISPDVTQNEASVWGHGSTVVAVYQDSSGAPSSYCAVSTSTDGGATFTRLPYKFTGLGSCFGDSSIFYSVRANKWFAGFLATSCTTQGVGQWESTDGINWSPSGCSFNSTAADLPSTWVDNNPASPFYGRQYTLTNDFDFSGGAPRVTHSTDDGATWSAPVTLFAGFRRAVKITGSLGNDGTIFAQLLDEGGGGLNGPRQNYMTRSTDGGVTWSTSTQGGTFFGPGRSVSGYFPGMYSTPVAGYWRDTGFGRPGVGPNGVVHYVYSSRPTSAVTEPGNIQYIRSTDNGVTWSTPLQLNTDGTSRAQWGPSIAVNAFGLVVASWYDERNTSDDSLQRYARISTDNGATWDSDAPLSDVIFPKPLQPDTSMQAVDVGIYNNAAFSDDNFGNEAYHVWTDGRNLTGPGASSQQDVYFKKVTLVSTLRTVTTTDDHDDGACSEADCSLREAINAANAAPGVDVIGFAPAVRGAIQLTSALPAITGTTTVEGPGADLLTVRRNVAGEFRIFHIDHSAVTISGLTISNGRLTPSGSTGAGIYNNAGTLTLTNCALTGHTGYAAGALYNGGGSAVVSNCAFSGNSAFEGGAIDNAAIGNTATLSVTNSTFSGNSASSNGGAVSNGSFAGTASLTLTNCTFSGNSSPTGGALNSGASFGGTATTFVRSTIFKTGASGANIANSGGTITSHGHNLSNDAAGGDGGTGPGGFLFVPGDKRNTDPLLGPLQNNGGPTSTHALLAGSPAINAGNDAFAPPSDQRGYIRVGVSDIGAFESGGVPLRITSITRSGNDIVIQFDAVAGKTFRLQRRPNLSASSSWNTIPGVSDLTAMSTGTAQFTDPDGAAIAMWFYRVGLQP